MRQAAAQRTAPPVLNGRPLRPSDVRIFQNGVRLSYCRPSRATAWVTRGTPTGRCRRPGMPAARPAREREDKGRVALQMPLGEARQRLGR
jgi:hypothetical protein